MTDCEEFHITIGHSPASDGWGFVGSVKIAGPARPLSAYRGVRADGAGLRRVTSLCTPTAGRCPWDHECYRTLRVFPTPTEALRATQVVVGDVLGALLAGQEWRTLSDEVGRTPTRADLRLGLTNAAPHQNGAAQPE